MACPDLPVACFVATRTPVVAVGPDPVSRRVGLSGQRVPPRVAGRLRCPGGGRVSDERIDRVARSPTHREPGVEPPMGVVCRVCVKVMVTVEVFRRFIPTPFTNRERPNRVRRSVGGKLPSGRAKSIVKPVPLRCHCRFSRMPGFGMSCANAGVSVEPSQELSAGLVGRGRRGRAVVESHSGITSYCVARRFVNARSRKKEKKTPPPVPCESSFGNPLCEWVPLGWVSDPATVPPLIGEDGLASATRIKMKAPKAG